MESLVEYIRGWRQLKAIFYFIECTLKRNLPCAKRELEIFFGFAIPYQVFMMCGVCGLEFPPCDWDGTVIGDTGQFVCSKCR